MLKARKVIVTAQRIRWVPLKSKIEVELQDDGFGRRGRPKP